MNRFAIIIFGLLIALSVTGCAKKAPEAAKSGAAASTTKAAPAAAKSLHDAGPVGDPAKGAKTYAKVCFACHQKDGKGMGGMLGANFVDDKTRLAKPDSVLLASIRDGKKGKAAIMPAQKAALSEQEMKDVLAYIRKTFGDK